MRLRILLPSRLFLECNEVKRIVAETASGFFGIWPRRLDCVAPLVPGVFLYEARTEGERFVAVDEGLLVKTDLEVTVVVRNAIGAADLGQVRKAVEREIFHLDEYEKGMRAVLAKLESRLARRLMEIHHERKT
ncbi:MAG: F0F1 ATP synthase subunit epsilon [Verrucomicrobiota bacterium]